MVTSRPHLLSTRPHRAPRWRPLAAVVLATALSVGLAPAADAAHPGRNGVIAFTGSANGFGGDTLGVVRPRSGRVTPLLVTGDEDPQPRPADPVWMPDGRALLFRSGDAYAAISPEGFDRRLLGARDGEGLALAPDGRRVAYTRVVKGRSRVATATLAGGRERLLTTGDDPSWSPDGRQLAVRSPRRALTVVDTRGRLVRRLVADASSRADWAPDGRRLVVTRSTPARTDLATIGRDGRGLRWLTSSPRREETSPVWSPDGKQVAYLVHRVGEDELAELWIVRASGGRPRKVATLGTPSEDEPFDGAIAWQPVTSRETPVPGAGGGTETPAPAPADPAGQPDLFRVAPGSPVRRDEDAGAPAVADFNRDGRLDLVTPLLSYDARTSSRVRMALGDGAGAFADGAVTATPTPATNGLLVAAGDVDGDGDQDVATIDIEASTASTLLGDGAGGLRPAEGAPARVAWRAAAVAVGDVNRDGRQDLIVGGAARGAAGDLTVLLGTAAGGFASAAAPPTLGTAIFKLALADRTGDGHLDLVVLDDRSNVSVLANDGAGGFRVASTLALSTQASAMTLADVDGDGRQDLAVAAQGEVRVHLAGDGGGFAGARAHLIQRTGMALALVSGDYDADGRADLAVADMYRGRVRVYLGTGTGAFREAPLGPAERAPGQYLRSLVAADVNADGRQDLLAPSNPTTGTSALTVLTGTGLPVRPRSAADALTIAAEPARLRLGDRVEVTGAPRAYALDSRPVTLWRRLGGAGAEWQPVVTVRSFEDDAVRVTDRPSADADYQWRFAGDETLLPAVSEPVRVTVTR